MLNLFLLLAEDAPLKAGDLLKVTEPAQEIVQKAAEQVVHAPVLIDPFIAGLTVFSLAVFVGFEIITKIPPTLHTPLMSGSNAISGITVVGALIATGQQQHDLASYLGFIAIVLAMINVVGGFLVTHRMLQKFKR